MSRTRENNLIQCTLQNVRLLSGRIFRPVFLYLDYLEMIHHLPETDPQRQKGLLIHLQEQEKNGVDTLTHPGYHEGSIRYRKGGMGHLIYSSSPRTATWGQYSQIGWRYELIHRLDRCSRAQLAWIVKDVSNRSGRGSMNKRGEDVQSYGIQIPPLGCSHRH